MNDKYPSNDKQFERLLDRLTSIDNHLYQMVTWLVIIAAALGLVGMGTCAIAGAL